MCGIIGILGKEKPITDQLFRGMVQMQHRGQEASGALLFEPKPFLRKKSGWVFELLQEGPLPAARYGLGHIRYSTSGNGKSEEIQPFVQKDLAIVHNGNIINYLELYDALKKEGVEFQTHSDSEALLHILSQNFQSISFDGLCDAINAVYERVAGAFSVIGAIANFGIFAFRDPKGFRPLNFGKTDDFMAIASETLPLTHLGCRDIVDVIPGEVIFIDLEGHFYQRKLVHERHSHCAFEFNYFAKPPTVIEGKEVYSARSALGRALAEKIKKLNLPHIDVVVPIPDSGNPAGIALAQHLGVPFAEGFIRHQSVGRTFILPGSANRQKAAFQKLSPIRSVFDQKTVLLVDDSIVRGDVSKRTVELGRSAGAKKILFASTFPPIAHPCIYGIDFPSYQELIAVSKSPSEIAEAIGADCVIFNDVEDLKKAIGLDDLCLACVTGNYPISTDGVQKLQLLREKNLSTYALG